MSWKIPWPKTKKIRQAVLALSFLFFLAWYVFWALPQPLFQAPLSPVLLDRNGQLLGAKIAADGQWRFPPPDSLPAPFVQALICFEDQRFYEHWGLDFLALGRASLDNLRAGRIVSGASTLSMQVVRLSQGKPNRNWWQKLKETLIATRLEWAYSKDEILKLYATHAPFGGNVVGLEAAAWRYFGRNPHQLSWAEYALLAVLPNSPALIHLNRNRSQLKAKRDRLLDKLLEQGQLDSLNHQLALLEELPLAPKPLPRLSPHLLELAHNQKKMQNGPLHSTLRSDWQERLQELAHKHNLQTQTQEIHNLALVVVEVETNDILAYIGNAPQAPSRQDVDMIWAERSSGSILKPLLYAASIQEAGLLPEQLLPDVPVQFRGYSPKNFSLSYAGAVPASKMVSASLNIPSVFVLQQYGLERFYQKLKTLGITTLHQPAQHYGLSLIVGGAETRLGDLVSIYAGMARTLRFFANYNGQYDPNNYRPLNYEKEKSQGRLKAEQLGHLEASAPLQAGAIWHSFQAMQEVVRPENAQAWRHFSSSQRVAWKTGTSFGFRDAWAIGCTPRYVVGVWVGNASGEGRPNLTGLRMAAPLLFDALALVDEAKSWFDPPYDEMQTELICRASGCLPNPNCDVLDTVWLYRAGLKPQPCPYHQIHQLSPDTQHRVNSDCESPSRMQPKLFFVLPTAQEFFYAKQHPHYKRLPPWRKDCQSSEDNNEMSLIYPSQSGLRLQIPRKLDGSKGQVVFRASHRQVGATIYWHLNNEYLGQTQTFHEWGIEAAPGPYTLTLVDEQGRRLNRSFEIE